MYRSNSNSLLSSNNEKEIFEQCIGQLMFIEFQNYVGEKITR